MKVGEFAKICRTTKETLLHYDRKGILKPRHVAENGYRCYGLEQYFEYDMIALFKDAGCTLEEIGKNRATGGENRPLEFIKGKISDLREKQWQIARRIAMFARMTAMAEEAASTPCDALFYQEWEKEDVLCYPVDPQAMTDRTACVHCYSDCLLDGMKNGNSTDFPLGMVVPRECCALKKFNITSLFRKYTENETGDIRSIDAGTHACMFHHGDMESHRLAFNAFLDTIRRNKHRICSDLFLFDQMNYILFGVNPAFTAKYVIGIE